MTSTLGMWLEIKGAARSHTQDQISSIEAVKPQTAHTADMLETLYNRLDLIDAWRPERGEVPREPPPPWAPPLRKAWVGVDLDSTLAHYEAPWKGAEHVGVPIAPMVERVKAVIAAGYEVRIMTARCSVTSHPPDEVAKARTHIEIWCKEQFGQILEVTCEKDRDMVELWDDRAVGVSPNQGTLLSPSRVFPAPASQQPLPGLARAKKPRKRR